MKAKTLTIKTDSLISCAEILEEKLANIDEQDGVATLDDIASMEAVLAWMKNRALTAYDRKTIWEER